MKNFQLAMFESGLPFLDMPQDIAFVSALYKFAKKYKIKYILNGGNIATECVNYPIEYYYMADMRLVKDILKSSDLWPLKSYQFTSIYQRKILYPYFYRIKTFKPLNYVKFIKKEAIQELESIYNWKSYPQKHFESRFTQFFESYWLPYRFNFDARRVQFSSLILTGQLSRDDALMMLEERPWTESYINEEFRYISKKLSIDEDLLIKYRDMDTINITNFKNHKKFLNLADKFLSPLLKIRRGGSY